MGIFHARLLLLEPNGGQTQWKRSTLSAGPRCFQWRGLGGGGALDRLEPKSLRSDAKFCNGNKQQQKNDTALDCIVPMDGIDFHGYRPFIPARKNLQQHEQIQQAPWPATGGSSIWAVLHVAASAFHHVLFHSFKDHITEALGSEYTINVSWA